MLKTSLFYAVYVLIALCVIPTFAQDEMPAPVPELVEVEASDGLVLKGDIYRPENPSPDGMPTLVLFHELEQTRTVYNRIIPDFLMAGYVVLNVDLRGHGETGGTDDWVAAQADTQVWLAWLREQGYVRDDAIAIIGASVGSNVAIMGCAQDAECVTAIALSPVIRFTEFDLEGAVSETLEDRSVLLISGHRDGLSADTVRTLFAAATGDISARLLPGGAHGTGFLSIRRDRDMMRTIILDWLKQEMPQPAADS